MSTHAYIAEKIDNNQVRVIYCHTDGYLEWTGDLLSRCYNTPEKVKELIDLGDLSILYERLNPDPSKPHGFEYDLRQPGVTVAYGRDRGETDTQAQTCSISELEEVPCSFSYLFDGDKWLYYDGKQWILLSEALSKALKSQKS